MNLKLSPRLSAVADMITKGSSVADVGTDHGYIPIYLALNRLTQYALAMDVNEGPLGRAAENIRAYGVEDVVSTRLSDGLAGLDDGGIDSIVIAGMGGLLIMRILENDIYKAHTAGELVLSPHSDVDAVRGFLARNDFRIADERIVKDEGKYYFVIKAINGHQDMPEGAPLYYGAPLLERKDVTLKEYLDKELALRGRILDNLKSNSVRGAARIAQIENEISIIREGLSYYES